MPICTINLHCDKKKNQNTPILIFFVFKFHFKQVKLSGRVVTQEFLLECLGLFWGEKKCCFVFFFLYVIKHQMHSGLLMCKYFDLSCALVL